MSSQNIENGIFFLIFFDEIILVLRLDKEIYVSRTHCCTLAVYFFFMQFGKMILSIMLRNEII